jgi:hypothetical protein
MKNNNQNIEFQAKEYAYELSNLARENDFKPGESWELSMATAAEKSAIEKNYYSTGFAKVSPEILNELLMLVKLELAAAKLNFTSIPSIGIQFTNLNTWSPLIPADYADKKIKLRIPLLLKFSRCHF